MGEKLGFIKVQLFWKVHKNLHCPFYGFDIYLVNVKTMRTIAQIFWIFSEKLNFICNDFVYIHSVWSFCKIIIAWFLELIAIFLIWNVDYVRLGVMQEFIIHLSRNNHLPPLVVSKICSEFHNLKFGLVFWPIVQFINKTLHFNTAIPRDTLPLDMLTPQIRHYEWRQTNSTYANFSDL